jgi:hypothetical protein
MQKFRVGRRAIRLNTSGKRVLINSSSSKRELKQRHPRCRATDPADKASPNDIGKPGQVRDCQISLRRHITRGYLSTSHASAVGLQKGGQETFARTRANDEVAPRAVLPISAIYRQSSTLRWFIAAAAAQGLTMSAHPFCEDEWIEVGGTSSLEEGAMR